MGDKMKHTPGPWEAKRNETRVGRDGNGSARIWWTINAGNQAIADITYPYSSRPRDEHHSNAILIASAPDLLATLINIRDNYDHDEDAHRYNTPCRSCEAAAAIKKATNG